MNQLLLTLRFYASSGHLIQTADFMNVDVSTTTVSRVIAYVSRLIASLRPRVVKMPHPQELVRGQNNFFEIAGFPKVLALIDCTHVKIDSPGKFLKNGANVMLCNRCNHRWAEVAFDLIQPKFNEN